MNITLTTKDADLILKYIRQDLERVIESDKKIAESKQRFIDCLENNGIKSDSFSGRIAAELLDFSSEVEKTSAECKTELTKCIRVLTCGSEE